MVSLISTSKAQQKIAESLRERRLLLELTQENLAARAGVALSTLRKFEQKGTISLESFLKLLLIVGSLEALIEVLKPAKPAFSSIEDVLNNKNSHQRKRGRKK